MITSPNELNSFVLRARFETKVKGVYYTFNVGADALINDINGIGEVKAFVREISAAPGTYMTTNDGASVITLNGVTCYNESLNGSYIYFTVRGGLPDGRYQAVIQFKRKNGSSQWDPRLSTKEVEITIVDQIITFS
jgi:hypothetical protein